MPDKKEAPKAEATFNQASVLSHEELEKQLQQKEAAKVGDRTGSREDLLEALQKQLEYYFSQENLSKDTYLLNQMTPEKYVEIDVIAQFTRVAQLTKDRELIREAMKRSKHMEVIEKNGVLLVQPRYRTQRTTLILRNIPTDTPQEKVRAIFAECPLLEKLKNVKGDISNTWFLQWDSEDACLEAAMWTNKHAKFQGEPVKCRVKSENFSRSSGQASGSSGTPFPYMPQYTKRGQFPYAPAAQQGYQGNQAPYGRRGHGPPKQYVQQPYDQQRYYSRNQYRGQAQFGNPNRPYYQQTGAYRNFRGGHSGQGRQRTYPPAGPRGAAPMPGGGRGRKPGNYSMPPQANQKSPYKQPQVHKNRTVAPENKPKPQNVGDYARVQDIHQYDKESMFAILNKLQRQRKAVLPPGIVRTDEDMRILLRKEPISEAFASKPVSKTPVTSPNIRGRGGGRGRGGRGRGNRNKGRGRYNKKQKNYSNSPNHGPQSYSSPKKGHQNKGEGNKQPKSQAAPPAAGKSGATPVQSAGTSQAPIFLD